MLMKRMTKRLMLALTTALLLTLLTITAYAGTIPGTAKLTITPTETKVSGDTATVTYSVTVTPPEGKALGVFSVQLQPSVGMTLAQDASGLTYGDGNLGYSAIDRTGIFEMYGYTASTGYFAAVAKDVLLSLTVNDKTTGTLTLEPRAADEPNFDAEFDGGDEERDDSDW